MILFVNSVFNINNNVKTYFIIGYVTLVFIPFIFAYSIYLFFNDYDTGRVIFVVSSVGCGIIYWIFLIYILIFEKKIYRNADELYVFLSISFFYFFYCSYPVLMIFYFDLAVQMIFLNAGILITSILINIYLIQKKFFNK
ncbi:MAG: hypothetical protein A2086_12225 [Spirochaetes bacterium GWD1_27_9]|nr:MAG: hypothetical protein A2086_12225 [Spirochaetes bacterium GWD1_27_9]